jgi:nickel transport protein
MVWRCPMRKTPSRPLRLHWLAAIILAVALHAAPAWAHKLSVVAVAEGTTIRGRAYLHGSAAVRGATVSVFDPQGQKLGQTTTDEQGKFTLEARTRCDHRIIVDSGDGHRAECEVRAAALPASLPARGELGSPAADQPPEGPATPAVGPGAPAPAEDQQLKAKVELLAQQVEQLQTRVAEFGQQARLQDIVGGLGYILGLMGLAFYFLGVRRKERRERREQKGETRTPSV